MRVFFTAPFFSATLKRMLEIIFFFFVFFFFLFLFFLTHFTLLFLPDFRFSPRVCLCVLLDVSALQDESAHQRQRKALFFFSLTEHLPLFFSWLSQLRGKREKKREKKEEPKKKKQQQHLRIDYSVPSFHSPVSFFFFSFFFIWFSLTSFCTKLFFAHLTAKSPNVQTPRTIYSFAFLYPLQV